MDSKTLTILCGTQGCCPTIEVTDDVALVKDDFGDTVKMSVPQLVALAHSTIKALES